MCTINDDLDSMRDAIKMEIDLLYSHPNISEMEAESVVHVPHTR